MVSCDSPGKPRLRIFLHILIHHLYLISNYCQFVKRNLELKEEHAISRGEVATLAHESVPQR